MPEGWPFVSSIENIQITGGEGGVLAGAFSKLLRNRNLQRHLLARMELRTGNDTQPLTSSSIQCCVPMTKSDKEICQD